MMINKDEIKGKADEAAGKVTGDDSQELKGKAQGFFGKMKESVKDGAESVSEKANEAIDKVKDKFDGDDEK